MRDIDGTVPKDGPVAGARRPNLSGRLWHRLLVARLSSQRCPSTPSRSIAALSTQITENDAAVRLIHGMISLAHSIGKRVVVEGVETTAQLEILRNLHCDEVQGFLLGRPAPFDPSRSAAARDSAPSS